MSFVLRMIAEGEHQQQDFKLRVDDAAKIAKTLCAFANSQGGRLLIGVRDSGEVAGCRVEEEFHMAMRGRSALPPLSRLSLRFGSTNSFHLGDPRPPERQPTPFP